MAWYGESNEPEKRRRRRYEKRSELKAPLHTPMAKVGVTF